MESDAILFDVIKVSEHTSTQLRLILRNGDIILYNTTNHLIPANYANIKRNNTDKEPPTNELFF